MKNTSFVIRLFNALKIPTLIAVCAVLFFFAIANMNESQSEEMRLRLEDAIRQSAVACYAAEGKYPESLDYLEKNYGVQIDRERYNVFYEVFAENLMPNVAVVEDRYE